MTPAAVNPWTRNWAIVSADQDIAHVMLPLNDFRLESVSTPRGPAYQLMHNCESPNPDCFWGSVLVPLGQVEASFYDITKLEQLPSYSANTASQYVQVAEVLGTYLAQNPQVQRLEGFIKIPCHANGAQLRDGALQGHAPLNIRTTVQLYQFPNAVEGGLPLLLVRTPLSPVCPLNSDGTAVGLGKN
jgi:hypothetical protein